MQIDRNLPLRIASTQISGTTYTRNSTIENKLSRAYSARTVQDVAQGTVAGAKALEQLGIFDHVDFELVPGGGKPGECVLKIVVKEKRVLSAKATTFVEQGEGGVEVAAKLLNALGSAESFEVSALMGGSEIKSTAPKHSQIRGEYVQPEVRGLPFDLVVSADSTSNKPLGDAPYEEISLGGAVRVKSTRGSVAGNGLEFEWFARQRDILPSRGGSEKGDDIESYTYSAPQEIVALARPSIKSAVAVQYGFNAQQPSSLNPRTGRAGFGRLEFAYPNLTGGDVGLLSLSGKMKSSQIVFPESDVSLTVALEAALLRPLGPNDVVHLSDRLFLGGPMFLRGFQPRGCGPRSGDGKAALGGTNRWQARVGLEGPPPPFEFLHSTTRTHAFLAAGALSNEFSFKSLLKDDLRLSCGFGLAFAIVIGRIEANVAYAIKAKEFDALSGRLQFGVGGEFL